MASKDSSFNAEGPTVVAFETVGLTPSDVPAFGVAVYAHQCGVNGIALSDIPANAHLVAPDLVGVHGLGENEGVRGEGPIGVHGIFQDPGSIGGQAIGVQGEGPIGVHGIAKVPGSILGGGIGVQGTGGNIGAFGKGESGVRGEGTQIGVEGHGRTGMLGDGEFGVRGSGRLAGVQGFSKRNRGGIFQTGRDELPALDQFASEISAQVLLVPVLVGGRVERHLPRTGLAGDLLAIISYNLLKEPTTELWFCVRDGSADPAQAGAVWAQVQFATTYTVP